MKAIIIMTLMLSQAGPYVAFYFLIKEIKKQWKNW